MNDKTLLHITHWKAGSQWIKAILSEYFADRLAVELPDNGHFLKQPVTAGLVYPALFVSRWQFDKVTLPAGAARFVVIRDLRDTLVSMYFSFKGPHPENSAAAKTTKAVLNSVSEESGYIYLIHEVLLYSALIQRSWLEAGEKLFRYETFIEDDLNALTGVLVGHCGMEIDKGRFEQVIRNHRFEKVVNRPRGVEDRTAHERKGVAGDWRNHFTPRIKDSFKDKYGALLIETGYERTLDW